MRLIKERVKENYEIHIVAFDEIYKIDNTVLQIPEYKTVEEKNNHFENPFLYVSKQWWNLDGTTVILFGDVYFTEKAMDIIINNSCTIHQYMFYGRSHGSSITGCKYGEIFAISFASNFADELWNTIIEVKKLKDDNKINRFISWEIYRKLQSIDLSKHIIKDNFIQIDDFTEDFDYPHDYNLWIGKWNKQIKI